MPEPIYCAIIADVVRSRDLEDRRGFQERLITTVESLDEELPPDVVVSRCVVTAGDEFQGLLKTPAPAYGLLVALEEALGFGRFRMGVGIGGVVTEPEPVCLGMDGPAFHRAREALLDCKARDLSLSFRSGRPELDALLTSYVSLLERVRLSWSPRQRAFIRELSTGRNQASAAEVLGVSKAAVTQALKAAGWRRYRQARADLVAYLSSLGFEWAAP